MKPETYVFGMAKSSLNLIGAKRQKLELDYLRLVYVCQHYQQLGHWAKGFLAVTTDSIVAQAAKWQSCYQVAPGIVEVVLVPLTEVELIQLAHFQNLNRVGMTGTLDKKSVAHHADATYGRELVESKLMAFVQNLHPGVMFSSDFKDPEMKISWDLFGKL